ncbi:hypothetical protein [Panacibacter microcysteis]|uniref:hypothetical protein n=1 Tax=Panacibacter microcysteis TaxID=2793269 RepID=UPI0018C92883|nr:hypothetical protein [Panacibacter microcysteis]
MMMPAVVIVASPVATPGSSFSFYGNCSVPVCIHPIVQANFAGFNHLLTAGFGEGV